MKKQDPKNAGRDRPMIHNLRAIAASALFSLAGMAIPAGSVAQSPYPDRPIKVVSPFVAGSVSDTALRFLADSLAAKSGIQMILQNQPGAGGITAAMSVKSSPADGYTVALFSNATAISVSLFRTLPFDTLADFKPVSGVSDFSYVLMVPGNSKYSSMQELLADARARPGALNIGTAAVGTTPHLAGELLKSTLGINVTTVPFRGSGDLALAVSRGDVDFIIDTFAPLQAFLVDGKVRALAVTSAERAKMLPSVPTLQESGIAGFEVSSWNGLYVPNGVPPEHILRLRTAVDSALNDPQLQGKFEGLGASIQSSPPEKLDARMRSDIDKWGKVIAATGIERQ